MADPKTKEPAAGEGETLLDSDLDKMIAQTQEQNERLMREGRDEAMKKLKAIGLSYQRSSPDEHVLFGAAGVKFTLGDMRNLLGIRQI